MKNTEVLFLIGGESGESVCFFLPITQGSKAKRKQTRITFDTRSLKPL